MDKYGGQSAAVLYDTMRTTMPTANPGSLDAATYAALTAFILRENDIVAGDEELPARALERVAPVGEDVAPGSDCLTIQADGIWR